MVDCEYTIHSTIQIFSFLAFRLQIFSIFVDPPRNFVVISDSRSVTTIPTSIIIFHNFYAQHQHHLPWLIGLNRDLSLSPPLLQTLLPLPFIIIINHQKPPHPPNRPTPPIPNDEPWLHIPQLLQWLYDLLHPQLQRILNLPPKSSSPLSSNPPPPPLLTLRKLILSHSLRRRIAHLPSLRPHPRRLQPPNASWTLIPTHLRILDAACNNVATSFFKGRLYITSGAELYVCRVEESSELVRIPTVYPKQMANEVTGWWRCMVETLAGDLLLVLWNCDSYWEKSDFYFEVYRTVLGEEGAKLR